ncbi:MAG: glycosyltransferase [Bacteroidetes bacterium]|nr:glycosyltransferase [Bacteroidota bacterium]
MKIAIIGSRGYPYVYSGYETFVSELSTRLIGKGHQVTVYCHKRLFSERPRAVNGVNLVYLPAIETKSASQFSHSLLSTFHVLFKSVDIVLYVNSANGPFGFITTLATKKTAINVDGLEWLRPKWRGIGSKYFYLAAHLATKLFDEIITDSERMREIYLKEFHTASTVIEYGADLEYSTSPQLLRTWGLESGGYYLIVGRLVPDNNADIIIQGFMKTASKRKLVVVGDVPYSDSYAANIKKSADARLLFTGYVDDQNVLRELYSNCFAYFHGHEYGGTNPTLLKALANGCCILALDTIFSREVLAEGQYGVFFKKNADSVTEIVNEIEAGNIDMAQLKYRARGRILERYTWDRITHSYEKLFSKMLSK